MPTKKLTFVHLSPVEQSRFAALKTTQDLKMHGPLEPGEIVPVHQHAELALYYVTGRAQFTDGVRRKTLGKNAQFNAVVVPPAHPHGWRALAPTIIEHCFGASVESVLQGI